MSKKIDDIVKTIAAVFPTFGGSRTQTGNPIAEALKNKPPIFALGVDVKQVVELTLKLYKKQSKEPLVKECDATQAPSSNEAGSKNKNQQS